MLKKFVLVCSIVLTVGPVFADATARIYHHAPKIQDRYIVALQPNVNIPDVAQNLAQTFGGHIIHIYTSAFAGFAMTMPEPRADALSRHPLVRWIEEDVSGSVTALQSPTPSWGLDRIDQQSLPLDNTYNYFYTGANITAYVVDTGVNLRSEFGGRVTNRQNFVSANDGAPDPLGDCYGHGTSVAGVIGGTNYGVAKMSISSASVYSRAPGLQTMSLTGCVVLIGRLATTMPIRVSKRS